MATWREVQRWLDTLPHRGERPIYYDGDYFCSICGEPWDRVSVREDMPEEWAKKFMKGLGCPDCKGKPRPRDERVERSNLKAFFKKLAETITNLRLLGRRSDRLEEAGKKKKKWIQKVVKDAEEKGTKGKFREYCLRKGYTKVTKKCIQDAEREARRTGNMTLLRRAVTAKNMLKASGQIK